jgi:hypothetical protein
VKQPNATQPSPYELFWQQKPWWCQPWSILLTGVSGIILDLLAYQRFQLPVWLVAPPLVGILGWWILFLAIVPLATTSDKLDQ